MTANRQRPRTETPASDATTRSGSPSVEATTLLSLLGDEYACEIVRTLTDEPLPARELVDRCGMSRPTVYRRLDRLTDAGIVDAEMSLTADGHHHREFSLAVDQFGFEVHPDGIDGFSTQPSATGE